MNEKEACFKIWEKRFLEQEKYIEEMRSYKHDLQAHMIVLQYYLDTGFYEEAKRYIKNMRNLPVQKVAISKVDTGNQLIDIIIEDYINNDIEINFLCEGKMLKEMGISSYDLCVLISNIIANAVEACKKLCVLQKNIYMRLEREKNNFIIIVENPIEWEIEKDILGNRSTKTDIRNHGYGLKNVRDIVIKYKGELAFEIKENVFCVKIEVPLKVN